MLRCELISHKCTITSMLHNLERTKKLEMTRALELLLAYSWKGQESVFSLYARTFCSLFSCYIVSQYSVCCLSSWKTRHKSEVHGLVCAKMVKCVLVVQSIECFCSCQAKIHIWGGQLKDKFFPSM